jgi:hypothetical protein
VLHLARHAGREYPGTPDTADVHMVYFGPGEAFRLAGGCSGWQGPGLDRAGRGRDLLAVFSFVLCHDIGRDAAAIVDLQAPLFGPVAYFLVLGVVCIDPPDAGWLGGGPCDTDRFPAGIPPGVPIRLDVGG